MKKYYTLIIGFLFFGIANGQVINFPDIALKASLMLSNTGLVVAQNQAGAWFRIDANYDGEIQQNEALEVTFLNVSYSLITNLTGIEYFTNLKRLNCAANQLTNLDFSSNLLLNYLDCSSNPITNLNLSINVLLNHLDCSYNHLGSLNLNSNVH
jgi:hypothetical protein